MSSIAAAVRLAPPDRSRRGFLVAGAALAAVSLLRVPAAVAQSAAPAGPLVLAPLPYAANALEPHIDTETMELHHGRHHRAFVDAVNRALADHGQLHGKAMPELLSMIGELPEGIRTTIRNAGGGHANHAMFWTIMGPGGGGAPTGAVADAITQGFGSFDAFKDRFNQAGTRQFGSGWVFVTAGADGALEIGARPNQDSPLMDGRRVLMGNDVWEHAYYLKYRNRRADYLAAWWNTVNWSAVNARLAAIRAGRNPDAA